MAQLVSGTITFDDGTHFDNATVFIRLESVGMMDQPASVVAEDAVRGVSYHGSGSLAFTLNGDMPDDPAARYNLRVHVSMDGSADIAKGDYMTKQSYPVEKAGTTGLIVQAEAV